MDRVVNLPPVIGDGVHFRRTWRRILPIALVWTALPADLAQAQHAHVHGIAEMQISVDGPTLKIRLESPLESLLGFEHAPKNDREKAAVRSLSEQLGKPEALFVPTAAARCKLASSKVDSPVLGAAGTPGAAGDGGKGRDAHKHGEREEEHAELEGEFVFRCEQPASLRELEVKLFDSFRRLRRLDVQVAGPRGQSSAQLTTRKRRVSW